MRFTVLGSGTTSPDPERGPAGFAVTVDEQSWWVDGGSGTLQRSVRAGIDPRTLRGGIYSHRHPDHCADLVPLLFTLRVDGRREPYPVWAGRGFADFVHALRGVWGRWIDVPTPVVELPLDQPGEAVIADRPHLVLRTAPAAHGAGALHLRFEADGASVVFSGDTGPSEALVELARGADLLVCECGGPDAAPIPDHLTPSGVADIAARAGVGEVWLTHLYPEVDPGEAVATVAATGIPTRHTADGDVWVSEASRG